MAVPFSNTHLRVPGGFGSILEGLAREVLRHQPEDIPTYAAVYFEGLLKEREESGLDPAEWAAKLQDRFYNNRAFQAVSPATKGSSATVEKSQTESEASGQVSSHPSRQPDGVTGDLQESDNQGTEEKVTTEEGVSSEDCGKEEEDKDPTLFTTSKNVGQELTENNVQFSTDKDISQSELDNTNVLLSPSNSMKDVCAEELGGIEHDEEPTTQERGTTLADNEVRDTSDIDQSTTDAEKVTDKFPYRLADVDVCAEELQQTEETDVVKDDLNARTTEGEEIHGDSSLSETHPGDTHELLLSAEDAGHHMQETEKLSDTDAAPQEEALVEINFDDVPEVQETVDTQEPGDERSLVEHSEQREHSESQLHEDVTGADSVHAEDGAENIDDPTSEPDEQEKEGKVEGEETEDHKVADISMEMDAGDLSMSNVGYEGGLNETMLLGTETAHLEGKTDFDNDDETDNYDASEVEDRGNNDPETLNMYDETEDPPEDIDENEGREIGGEDVEDTQTGLFSEMEHQLPSESYGGVAGIKSDESKPEIDHYEEAEAVAAKGNPVEMKEIARASVEPQPEDSMEDTEDAAVIPQTTGAGNRAEEVEIDDEGRGRDNAMGEGSVESYLLGAGWAQDDSNQAEPRLPEAERDVVHPETKDGDKEGECSRPQEEEEDIMDIPLDDPEANKAAAKIQAGFRGHMTRKKMKPEEKAEGEERQEERGQ